MVSVLEITTFVYQNMTEFIIKNMVCDRCKMVVSQEVEKHGMHISDLQLGIVHIRENVDKIQRDKLAAGLSKLGFELLDDAKSRIIEQIKRIIIEHIHYNDDVNLKINWSSLVSDKLHHDYKQLSGLFSAVEGVTLEQYIIRQKIERVKELLFYDELSLSEISYKLGYSSVAHLSAQFKKITGQTPSQFKASRSTANSRRSLDAI